MKALTLLPTSNMATTTTTTNTKLSRPPLPPSTSSRLFVLDTSTSPSSPISRILSFNPDGSDVTTVLTNLPTISDGITIDHINSHIYWTNAGTSSSSSSAAAENSGSIERVNMDGSDRHIIVPRGSVGVHMPKQICVASRTRMLYWCDREGMKVMRADLNGGDVQVLHSSGDGEADRADSTRWCVGITVDETRGWFYWGQKGVTAAMEGEGGGNGIGKGNSKGRIFRARIDDPSIKEVLFQSLPEPIDLELDEERGFLYWTGRGEGRKSTMLNRAFVGGDRAGGIEVLASNLHETIGLALNAEGRRCYVTDLAGGVHEVDTHTKEKTVMFPELGDLSGIALVPTTGGVVQ